MPTAPKRPHRAALTRMLRFTGLARMPDEAPLVELLRTLADELDQGGGSRARAEYLSALKDARRVLNYSARPARDPAPAPAPAAKPEAVIEDVEDDAGPVSDLTKFRQKHKIS